MARTSPAEIKVPSLHQLGIAVKDAEKVAQNYWNILGIGPWDIITLRYPHIYDRTHRGKPKHHCAVKLALTHVGQIELALMETLESDTTYSDFMAGHGEGPHHLQYEVGSLVELDKHVELMAKKGASSAMSFHFGNGGGVNYIDATSTLKAIWGVVKIPDELSAPTIKYPVNESAISPAKAKVKAITKIGIVVKNLEAVMESYWNLLGIGPWEVCEVVPPTLHDITYYGKPGNYTMRVAFARVGPIQIELLQRVSGDNLHRDLIWEQGEGIHHIGFLADDINETTQIMEKAGFPTVMSGKLFNGSFAYYDTGEPLKTIWEAFQPPKARLPLSRFIPK